MSPFWPIGNIEIELFVIGVGLRFAQVPFHAARAQDGSGHAEGDAILGGDRADVLRALHPDAIGGEQLLVLVDFGRDEGQELLDVFFEAFVGFVQTAADAERVRGQARAAVLLENLQDLFAIAEGVEKRRHRADVERVRAQPKLVAGETVEFRQDDADVVSAGRRFDVEQLLDCFAVSEAVRDRGDVVHAVDVRIEHRVGAMFGDLFHAAVQVADDALEAHNLLAVESQDHAQHAVSGGMLRTHIDDEFVGVKESVLAFLEVQVRDGAGRVGHA